MEQDESVSIAVEAIEVRFVSERGEVDVETVQEEAGSLNPSSRRTVMMHEGITSFNPPRRNVSWDPDNCPRSEEGSQNERNETTAPSRNQTRVPRDPFASKFFIYGHGPDKQVFFPNYPQKCFSWNFMDGEALLSKRETPSIEVDLSTGLNRSEAVDAQA
jgi:hypothetical protein